MSWKSRTDGSVITKLANAEVIKTQETKYSEREGTGFSSKWTRTNQEAKREEDAVVSITRDSSVDSTEEKAEGEEDVVVPTPPTVPAPGNWWRNN